MQITPKRRGVTTLSNLAKRSSAILENRSTLESLSFLLSIAVAYFLMTGIAGGASLQEIMNQFHPYFPFQEEINAFRSNPTLNLGHLWLVARMLFTIMLTLLVADFLCSMLSISAAFISNTAGHVVTISTAFVMIIPASNLMGFSSGQTIYAILVLFIFITHATLSNLKDQLKASA